MTEYFTQYEPEGMFNGVSNKCKIERCGKCASFGVVGTTTVEYCAQHAPDGMVDVKSRKCRTEGCVKGPY